MTIQINIQTAKKRELKICRNRIEIYTQYGYSFGILFTWIKLLDIRINKTGIEKVIKTSLYEEYRKNEI